MNRRTKCAARIAYYCNATRTELMDKCTYYTVNEIGGYLGVIIRPGSKILAVAHIDYLGTGTVYKASRRQVVSSALDDRLGVYAAIEALPSMGVKCDVLLCDDEESANSSLQSVGMGFLSRYNWIVELDCSGVRAVTYGYQSMVGVLDTVYEDVSIGAFSDITSIEHVSPIGAFNAGVGYQNQHSEQCVIHIKDFTRAMRKIKTFYDLYQDVRFDEKHSHIVPEGAVMECDPSYVDWGMGAGTDNRFSKKDYIDDIMDRTPYMTEDPADKHVTRGPSCLLDGDQVPINDGHSEIECCEMCSKILMHDEVYLYQGWPVCQEHYCELTADETDPNNLGDRADEWEMSDG